MLKLIGATGPYVRKVRIALAEKGIAYTLVEESPYVVNSPVAELNPLGKIPVLVTEAGATIFDSRVIAEYVDTLSPVNRLLPDDWGQRISVKRWEALADGVSDALIAVVTESRQPPSTRREDLIARQREKVERGVQAIARELDTKPWCGGDRFSLADIATGCVLFHLDLRLPEFEWRAAYPSVARLANKLATRPSFIETAPVPG